MLRRHLLILCSIVFLYTVDSTGAEGKPGIFFSEDAPIEITSDTLTADSVNRRAVFEGHVVARQAGTVLKANWMEVTYNEKGDVIRILARGDVTITKAEQKVVADTVEYLRPEGIIIFTGNPVASDPDTIVEGTKMIYYTEDGRYVVENSRVVLKGMKQ